MIQFSQLHRLFFFLTLILLPTQLGYHFWPEWALVAGRRVDYLAPTVFLTDILMITTLLCWFMGSSKSVLRDMYYVLWKKRKTKEYGEYKSIIHDTFPIILIVIFAGINIWSAEVWQVAAYKWVKVAEMAAWGFYIVKTKPRLIFIVLSLSAAAFYSSVLAIWQFAAQSSVGGLWWFLGERTFDINTAGIARFNLCLGSDGCREILRPYATFPHPNVLAGFLAACILILYHGTCIMYHGKTIKTRLYRISNILIFTSIISGTIALALTFSRGAMVAGAVSWILYHVLWRKHKSAFSIILNTIPIILVTLMIFIISPPGGESVDLRQQLNAAAINIWRNFPVFGTGLGNFLTVLPHYLSAKTVFFLQPVHNVYLLILSETGILGFILIAYLLIKKVLSIMYQVLRGKQQEKTGPVLALLALLLIGMVDHYPLTLQQGQMMMTLLVALLI